MQLFGIPLNMGGDSRDNWTASMAQPVALSRLASEVSDADMALLREAHPDGQALVWGYHRDLGVQPGDVVVFAGGKSVHHVGRVGVPFTCDGLDGIWAAPANPYRYAYTVEPLRDTSESLSFDEFDQLRAQHTGIWRMPVKFGDFETSVMSDFLREEVLNLDRVPAINLGEVKNQAAVATADMDDELLVVHGSIRTQSVVSTKATVTATERIMTFKEIGLVDRFRQYCEAHGGTVSNLRSARGASRLTQAETDAVVEMDGKRVLVEAKTEATAGNVYTAIGQLAHYGSLFKAHGFTDRAFLAAGEIRDDTLRATLFEHGIDVVLERSDGNFVWDEAPQVYKDAWREILPLASAVTGRVEAHAEEASAGQQALNEAMVGFPASSAKATRRALPMRNSVPSVTRDAGQTANVEMEI